MHVLKGHRRMILKSLPMAVSASQSIVQRHANTEGSTFLIHRTFFVLKVT